MIGKYYARVYRETARKPKIVFSMRLSEEDVEFLRTLSNASEFIRDAISQERRKRRMFEAKGLPYEIVHEIAEAYVKNQFDEDEEPDIEWWNRCLAWPLHNIARLTLMMPDPVHSERINFPLTDSLGSIIEYLQSKEARDFIHKIKTNVEQATNPYSGFVDVRPEKIKPLTEDELDIVRKIFDEARDLLEQRYRRVFHKLPPEDWYMYFQDGSTGDKIRYKLP